MVNAAINLFTGLFLCLYLDLNVIEIVILLALFRFAGFFAHNPRLDRLERWFSGLATRRALCIGLAFVVPIVLRLSLLPWDPIPQPWIPDEFSHLLVGDTLVHGRLANPTHPLWQHFESIHVFFKPVYASDYFPGLGTVLALGTVLGHPWIGVLLAAGGMCAALLWMLYGFLPERWALLGGVLAIMRWGALSYWVNSYWGGSLGAIGGALVLGAYARIRRGKSWSAGWVLGAGLVMLIYIRPLEGFVFCVPVAIALLLELCHPRRIADLLRAGVPALLLIAIGLAGLGAYNRAITGNPLKIPYAVNQELYGWPLTLPWQKPVVHKYRNPEMQHYFEYERCIQSQKAWPGPAFEFSLIHLNPIWRFYIGPALMLPLLWGGPWWKDRRIRLAVVCLAASCALGFLLAAYPHYVSAAAGCFLIVIVQALRHTRAYQRKISPRGIVRSRVVVVTCLAMLPVRAFVDIQNLPGTKPGSYTFSAQGARKGRERAHILAELQKTPGQHVAFVQYEHDLYATTDWVYNGADIDGQQIVWARDMGAEKNQEVLQYYPNRKAWLVRPDDDPNGLLPYEPSLARVVPHRPLSPSVCPASWSEKTMASR